MAHPGSQQRDNTHGVLSMCRGRATPLAGTSGAGTADPCVVAFQKVDRDIRREHYMNILTAIATRSDYTHVEVALGDGQQAGKGKMRNVLRIYQGPQGVELVERTGVNPQFTYMSVWVSEETRQRMLQFAEAQKAKPFSKMGMLRTLLWPRATHQQSWFCAELTAAVLQVGGLIDASYNPGNATPESIHQAMSAICATSGNPFVVRRLDQYDVAAGRGKHPLSIGNNAQRQPLLMGRCSQETSESSQGKHRATAVANAPKPVVSARSALGRAVQKCVAANKNLQSCRSV